MNINRLCAIASFSPTSIESTNIWVRSGHAWVGHLPFAAWLVQETRPKVLVELGTHCGNSYFAFCQGVAACGIQTKCYAIDTWKGDPQTGYYGEDVFTGVCQHNALHYDEFSSLLRMTFDQGLSHFSDRSIDLLHLDGCHTYEAVRHDFEAWLPKLAHGAVVLFHDTSVRENNFGVWKLWEELRQLYPLNMEFSHSHGLGVLQLDALTDDGKISWLEDGCDEKELLINYFGALGASQLEKFELADFKEAYSYPAIDPMPLIGQGMPRKVELRQERDRLSLELQTLRRQQLLDLNEHERSTSASKKYREMQRQQIDSLEITLAQLQAELEKEKRISLGLLNSTSWKLTGPVRKAMALARALRVRRVVRSLGGFLRRDKLAHSGLAKIAQEIASSQTFDEGYYVENAPSCCSTGLAPIEHYLLHGAAEGKEPCVLFDTDYYLGHFDALERGSIKYPLHHYLTRGSKIGVNPHPFFDSAYYSKTHIQDNEKGINPLTHFLTQGRKRNYSTHPFFDCDYYLDQYPDMAKAGENPLVHYAQYGASEHRHPNSWFRSQDYMEINPDLASFDGSPLEHFILYGQKEGRLTAHPRLIHEDYLPVHGVCECEYVGVVDVVVPVYRGLEETRDCIESVLGARTGVRFRLVVIDDCSPEEELSAYLRDLPRDERLLVLRNERNLGFVGTVNKGMRLDIERDVILLNSDTLVPDYWLDRLLAHSVRDPKIATITPLSNNATICSYPKFVGSQSMPEGETAGSMSEFCYAANAGRTVDVPTGVGFCMYIRRGSLDELGYFDEEAFGKGYGEENDFCLRASGAGWRNVNALDVYVFHRGEVSFKDDSSPSKAKAQTIINERYPSYPSQVSRFVTADPSKPFRHAITARRLCESPKPCVLLIEHAFGGGTEKHTRGIVERFKGSINYLILRPLPNGRTRDTVLFSADPELGLEIKFSSQRDSDFIADFLRSCGVVRAHVHHLLGFSLDVRGLINELEIPFYFTVHDYFTICPHKNLLTQSYRYCGEPGVDVCNACIADRLNPECLDTKGHDITYWREYWGWFIKAASRVICPSYDVSARMRKIFTHGNFFVVPHESSHYLSFDDALPLAKLKDGETLRIGILGVLAQIKGSELVEEVASLIAENGRPAGIEFVCIGYTDVPAHLAPAVSLYQTGPYEDKELSSIIESSNLHAIWFPANCPETYSYTLTAALKSRLPIVATNLGAFIERLAGRGETWLVEPNREAKWWAKFFSDMRMGKVASDMRASDVDATSVKEIISEDFYEREYLALDDEPSAARAHKNRAVKRSHTIVNLVLDGNGNAPNACGYIRLLLPFKQRMIQEEFDVRVLRVSELSKVEGGILIAQRIALKEKEELVILKQLIAERGTKFIYEIDDDLLDLPMTHPEKDYYARFRKAIIEQMKLGNRIFVSTQALAHKCLAFNKNVTIRPNYLDETLWAPTRSRTSTTARATDKVKILYMGTATHQADFAIVKSALKRVCEEFRDSVEFCVIGVQEESRDQSWYTRLEVPASASLSYPAFVNWLTNNNDFSIGIAPLTDTEFNRAKSGLKFLDYSALGLLSICSDVESYRSLVVHKHNGLLIKNQEDDWYQAIKYAVLERQAALRMSTVAHQEIWDKHTLSANATAMLEILKSLHA